MSVVRIDDRIYQLLRDDFRSKGYISIAEYLNAIVEQFYDCEIVTTENIDKENEENLRAGFSEDSYVGNDMFFTDDDRELLRDIYIKVSENNDRLYGRNLLSQFDDGGGEIVKVYGEVWKRTSPFLMPEDVSFKSPVDENFVFQGLEWEMWNDKNIGAFYSDILVGGYSVYENKIMIVDDKNRPMYFYFSSKYCEDFKAEVERRLTLLYYGNGKTIPKAWYEKRSGEVDVLNPYTPFQISVNYRNELRKKDVGGLQV